MSIVSKPPYKLTAFPTTISPNIFCGDCQVESKINMERPKSMLDDLEN